MHNVFTWLNQPLPMGIFMLIGLGVLWFRVTDNTKALTKLDESFMSQLKWCVDHFAPKERSGQ